MKNILIFAGIAGLAAAIAIYFAGESNEKSEEDIYLSEDRYVSDEDIEAYDQTENTGPAYTVDNGFATGS